ncbi:MAG: BamA/TamA family outer membrane protein [Burkholderiales bacterium]|nr:BamA/TamA family outer membrane protein [Burkholderiales bacterium]
MAVLLVLATVTAASRVLAADDGASVASAEPTADDAKPAFDILEFVVDGNSVLTPLEIERAVYAHMGERRTIDDAEAARAALERAYQSQGWLTVTVDLPEQDVSNGQVRLQVTEGRVERAPVSGNRYWSRGWIRSRVPSLQVGEVPRFPDLQREINALNSSPERTATPVLRPGSAPGAVEIELKVAEQNPAKGSIELNNRNAAGTSASRLVATFGYDNLWNRDHKIGFTTILSPQDFSEVQVLVANYLVKLPESRNVLAVYAVRSRSDIAALGAISILGDADILGTRYVIPLDARDDLIHNVFLGADYKSFKEDIRQGGQPGVITPITYTPLTAQYDATRQGRKGVTKFNVTTTFAIRGHLFGNDDAEFMDRRFGARANYMVLKADLKREQLLPRRMTLVGRLGLQGASGRLINTEQYFAGGADTVRGYFEAEALGDDATFASLELRSPGLLPGDDRDLVAFGFTDAADVRTKAPRPGVPGSVNLWSVGAGVRFRQSDRIDAALELGVPMEDGPVRSRRGEPRLHARLAWKF